MKTALITGASTGIGKELAILHASKGGDVILVARSEDKLNALAKSLETKHDMKAYVIAQDLFENNAAQIVYDKVKSLSLEVDYLINNAGFGDNRLFKESDNEWNHKMIQLNIVALTDFCHLQVQNWIQRGVKGKILNVASTAAFQGVPYFSVYAATKAYVLSFSESLSIELKEHKIDITCLCPGPTRTEFAANAQMDQSLANSNLLPTGREVAAYGYRKMLQGQTIAVHGTLNRIGSKSGKLFPRSFVAKAAGMVMKKAGGH